MWEQLLGALTGLLIGIIAVAHKGIAAWMQAWFDRKTKNERDVVGGLLQLREMFEIFDRIMESKKVQRVLLFTGTNSGGLPRIDSPYYSEAIYGLHRGKSIVDPLDRYNFKRKVDREYIEMLIEVEKAGKIILETEKMSECKLRNYYIDEGVKHASIWYIGVVDNKFIYLSVATYLDEPFTSSEILRIELEVDRLKESLVRR